MSLSLDKLASNLPNDAFKYTSEELQNDKILKHMKQKGVYPYDYMDSLNRFSDKKLPNKDAFYSILNDEHVSDMQYLHAIEVWKAFKLEDMGEFHDLYIGSDGLLLAVVFENFRKTCMQCYGLDPCHYFTSPGLSWDAMLKMTDIKSRINN